MTQEPPTSGEHSKSSAGLCWAAVGMMLFTDWTCRGRGIAAVEG
jgi:hypothetical protein